MVASAADRSGSGGGAVHPLGSVILAARRLSKTYDMGEVQVRALRSVDLDLHGGELAVLLGASGSGKSTLLNIIGGLDRPTSGTIRYGDWDLSEADDQELTLYRRQYVGFVFQLYNLIPSLTARENVSLVSEIARDPMSPEEALELVGLGARLDHFPAQLSGGEQQRVAVARALANRPSLILADEPTAALDSVRGRQVMELFRQVAHEQNAAVIVVTHDQRARDVFDQTLEMEDGRVKGAVAEVGGTATA